MRHLGKHVLETAHGCPAAGMGVVFQRVEADGPLLDAASMAVGRYRLSFEVAAYFRARGVALHEPPFVDVVQLDFGIADAAGHYRVPLLVSHWSYSSYRGS